MCLRMKLDIYKEANLKMNVLLDASPRLNSSERALDWPK